MCSQCEEAEELAHEMQEAHEDGDIDECIDLMMDNEHLKEEANKTAPEWYYIRWNQEGVSIKSIKESLAIYADFLRWKKETGGKCCHDFEVVRVSGSEWEF